MSNSNIKLTIEFNDPELNLGQRDEQAQFMLDELKDIDEVTVNRILDLNPPKGIKAGDGFLVGLLRAEMNIDNVKKLFGFLHNRLGNRQIELTIEINGKKLSVKASSQEELEYAIKLAEDFIQKWS
jgi:hypothetical protein